MTHQHLVNSLLAVIWVLLESRTIFNIRLAWDSELLKLGSMLQKSGLIMPQLAPYSQTMSKSKPTPLCESRQVELVCHGLSPA